VDICMVAVNGWCLSLQQLVLFLARPRPPRFCLLGRRSVYTVLDFDQVYIAFVWLDIFWFDLILACWGYGLAGSSD